MEKHMTLEEVSVLVRNLEAEQEWRRRQSKRRLRRGFLLFLLLMLALSFICRIHYADQLPQIEWDYLNGGTMNDTVRLEGTVGTDSPAVVYGLEQLRISSIDVSAGEQVKAGDLLYRVDVEDLQEKIDGLTAEHGTWWEKAQNWYEDARTETAWYEAEIRQEKLAAWQALLEENGSVRAEEDGMILEVMAEVGERMDGNPVIRYSNENSRRMFQAVIPEEQRELFHVGDPVTVKFSASKTEYSGTIDWIEEEGGGYRATVWLEPGAGQGELEGTMELNYTSQAYDYVIPAEALHRDSERCCIYVLEEKEGILGTELSVRKVDVRLLEESSDRAAIAEELLESGMKIITGSSKELKDGDVVREKA